MSIQRDNNANDPLFCIHFIYNLTLENFKSSKNLKEDLDEKGYSSSIMQYSYIINEVEYISPPIINEDEYSSIRIGYKVPFDVAIPLLKITRQNP